MDLRRFEWSPCQAAKVRNVSKVGSQFKSFLFNVSPTEHAVCGTAAGPWLPITNYPSLLEFTHPWTPGSPQNPPSAFTPNASQRERRLKRAFPSVSVSAGFASRPYRDSR